MAGRGRGNALLEILRASATAGNTPRPGCPQFDTTPDKNASVELRLDGTPSVKEELSSEETVIPPNPQTTGTQILPPANQRSTLEEAIQSVNDRSRRSEPDELAACLQSWNPMEEDFNSPTFNSYDSGPGKDLPLQSQRPVEGNKRTSANYQLYVTGIPLGMTDSGLINLFSRAGQVVHARKMQSKFPDRPDTFGFVHFRLLSEIESAIRMLDNYQIGICVLRVRIARSLEEREAIRKRKEMEYRLGDEAEEDEEDVALPTVDADGNEITEPSEGTAVETNSETAVDDVTTSHTVRTESFPKTSLASCSTLHSISETVSEESILPETVSPSEKKKQPTDLPSKSQPVTSPKSTSNGKTPTVKQEPRPCLFCGMEAFRRCTRCQGAYCDAKCQTEDWIRHKVLCKKPNNEFEARFEIDDDEIDDSLAETIANQRVDVSSLQREALSPGIETRVILTDCTSPVNFSLVKAANFGKLEDLKSDMNKTFSDHTPEDGYSPEVGEVCAAPYQGEWYRAVVEQLRVAQQEAVVTFIDYGNQETLGLGHLAKLPTTMAGMPSQAMSCALPIEPVSEDGVWSSQSLQVLAQKLSEADGQLMATSLGGHQERTSVVLKRGDDEIAEYLISQKVAQAVQRPKDSSKTGTGGQPKTPLQNTFQAHNVQPRTAPLHPPNKPDSQSYHHSPSPVTQTHTHPVVEPFAPAQPTGSSKVTGAQQVEYIHKRLLVLGEQLTAQVVHIESIDEFWIQVDRSEEFEELQERLREVYHNKKPKSGFRCPKHMLVAAYSPAFQTWFRGKVVGYDTSKVCVYYLDYGNQERVDFSHVHSLDSTFCSLPAQALCCKLEGSHSKSQLALACFHSYVENARLEAKICGEEDGRYVVDLYDPNKEASLKDTLLSQFSPPRSQARPQKSDPHQQSPKQPSPKQPSPKQPSPKQPSPKQPSPKQPSPKQHSPIEPSQKRQSPGQSRPSPQKPSPQKMSVPQPETEPQLVLAASLSQSALPTSTDLHSVMVHEATCIDNVILYDVEKLDEYDTFLAQVDALLENYSGRYEPSTEGELVLVRDAGTGWLRGEVLRVEAGSKALVRLVDTNRIEDADFSDIAPVSADLKQPPIMAIRCCLWNLKSLAPEVDWALHVRPELCCPKAMQALVIRFGVPCHIEIFVGGDDSESLNNKLIRKGLVLPRVSLTDEHPNSTSQISEKPPENVPTVSNPVPPGKKKVHFEFDHNPVHIPPPSLYYSPFSEGETQQFRSPAPLVTVFHVEDPGCFYCQGNEEGVPEAFQEEEEAFRKALKQSRPKAESHTVEAGDMVAVLSPSNNQWYRAETLDKDFRGTGKLLVFLVDYGTKDLVAGECVRPLPADHKHFPHQAIRCGLLSWEPDKCPDTATAVAAVKEVLEGRTVNLILDGFREERYRVMDIREPKNKTSLVREGGVLYDVLKEESQIKDEVPRAVPSSDGDGPQPVVIPYRYTGQVTHINSISDFYVQEVRDEEDTLQERVNSHCERSSPPNPFRSKKGRLCCAKFSVDQQWYRARVLDSVPDGRLNVLFIDYGNMESVESSDTRPLPDDLADVPAKAYRCALYDLPEPDTQWQAADNERFGELVSSSALEVVSQRADGDLHLVSLTHPTHGDIAGVLRAEGEGATVKMEMSYEETLQLKRENEEMKRKIAALKEMLAFS